jgi:hypothetical protein
MLQRQGRAEEGMIRACEPRRPWRGFHFCMREREQTDPVATPSLVPSFDVTVYLVLHGFAELGRVYCETNEEDANLENTIENLLNGQYRNPIRVVAFDTSEGWSRDVSEDILWEVLKRCAAEGKALPISTRQFTAFHVGQNETLLAENSAL